MRQSIAVRPRRRSRIPGLGAVPMVWVLAATMALAIALGGGARVPWAPAGPPSTWAQSRSATAAGALEIARSPSLVGDLVAAPAPNIPGIGPTGRHVVRAGESLPRIARRYGLRSADLAHLNGTSTTALLLPGSSLWVPLAGAVDARALEPAGDGAVVSTAREAGGTGRYTVQPGDTLFALGGRFGVATDDLRRWNGLPADGFLLAGEELLVSPPGDEGAPPARTGGGATRDVVIVAPGDTLTSIAARFDTTVVALQRDNRLVGEFLHVGQTLTVPVAGAGAEGIPAGGGAKRIEVVVGEQRMYVWQGDTLVWSWVTSTGIASHPTRRGTFAVQSKIPNAWSSAWQLWMPNWLGIYWAGGSENGIHALPIINGQQLWAGSLGSPVSYGCIVLGVQEAELLYDWAEIGTPVDIRD